MKSTLCLAKILLPAMLALAAAASPVAAAPADTTAMMEDPVIAPRPPAEQLDMRALENRLRETKAIDPLSKLRLKAQIDDLVGQFREMHENGASGRVSSLRQPYERMIGKVQSLLGGDPLLANDIDTSREAIWHVLADPSKFRRQMTMKQ